MPPPDPAPYLSPQEKDVAQEINLARTQPKISAEPRRCERMPSLVSRP